MCPVQNGDAPEIPDLHLSIIIFRRAGSFSFKICARMGRGCSAETMRNTFAGVGSVLDWHGAHNGAPSEIGAPHVVKGWRPYEAALTHAPLHVVIAPAAVRDGVEIGRRRGGKGASPFRARPIFSKLPGDNAAAWRISVRKRTSIFPVGNCT